MFLLLLLIIIVILLLLFLSCFYVKRNNAIIIMMDTYKSAHNFYEHKAWSIMIENTNYNKQARC